MHPEDLGDPDLTSVLHRDLHASYPEAVSAQGSFIRTAQGREVLDAAAGAAVTNLGHGRPEIVEAMVDQLRRVHFAHTSTWTTAPQEELAHRLASLAPPGLSRAFFPSGGSESMETALKLARRYWTEREGPDSPRALVVGRQHSYHGATLGAMGVGDDARRAHFTPMLTDHPRAGACACRADEAPGEVLPCRAGCAEGIAAAIEAAGPERVMAVAVEPVVGAALGAMPAGDGYLARVREICDAYDVLLIADEVMTGFGRTGRMFAVEHEGVTPDLLVGGKGLGAGYHPIGTVLVAERIVAAIRAGSGALQHGFTYSGSPVGCAAGLAVLDLIEEHGLVDQVVARGEQLGAHLHALRAHPHVTATRGLGLMRGLALSRPDGAPLPASLRATALLRQHAWDEGLVVYPGRGLTDHVLLAPPLTIAAEEVDLLAERLDRALARTEEALAAASRGA